MAHPSFVDDRLDKDMVEIRKIMKHEGTNPVFEVEFQRTNDNDIQVVLKLRTSTMPSMKYPVSSLDKIGEIMQDYIKSTAEWM